MAHHLNFAIAISTIASHAMASGTKNGTVRRRAAASKCDTEAGRLLQAAVFGRRCGRRFDDRDLRRTSQSASAARAPGRQIFPVGGHVFSDKTVTCRALPKCR